MLKTAIFVSSLIILFSSNALSQASKTDDELLAETVTLSKKVKEFGKTLGIEPSSVLTKTTKDLPPYSGLLIYMQKHGTISNIPEIKFSFYFSKQTSDVPINAAFTFNRHLSIYWRQSEASSSDDTSISTDFANAPKRRQVEVILHEDLHRNTVHLYESEYCESLITPLGHLAAMNFFESIGDIANAQNALIKINYFRKVSKELQSLKDAALKIFAEEPNYFVAQEKVYEIVKSTATYSDWYAYQIKTLTKAGANPRDPLEALVSENLYYFKDFEKVVALYEKIGDLTTLIDLIKKTPPDNAAAKKYLENLEEKYSKPR